MDLERHTFVGSLNSLDSNINNAVATNFFIINVFWNDVSVIEWGKITYLYWYSFHLSNINSKRTYHKITRYLSWLLNKKTTGNMLVYFIWSWFIQKEKHYCGKQMLCGGVNFPSIRFGLAPCLNTTSWSKRAVWIQNLCLIVIVY